MTNEWGASTASRSRSAVVFGVRLLREAGRAAARVHTRRRALVGRALRCEQPVTRRMHRNYVVFLSELNQYGVACSADSRCHHDAVDPTVREPATTDAPRQPRPGSHSYESAFSHPVPASPALESMMAMAVEPTTAVARTRAKRGSQSPARRATSSVNPSTPQSLALRRRIGSSVRTTYLARSRTRASHPHDPA